MLARKHLCNPCAIQTAATKRAARPPGKLPPPVLSPLAPTFSLNALTIMKAEPIPQFKTFQCTTSSISFPGVSCSGDFGHNNTQVLFQSPNTPMTPSHGSLMIFPVNCRYSPGLAFQTQPVCRHTPFAAPLWGNVSGQLCTLDGEVLQCRK